VEGRFGKALNGRAGGAFAPARPDYRRPPLIVECSAKLHSKDGFNILGANENTSSPQHWAMFTFARTRLFTVYMPGMTPDHIRSAVDICDDRWHYLAMVYTAGRVRLYVDGKIGRFMKREKIARLGLCSLSLATVLLYCVRYPCALVEVKEEVEVERGEEQQQDAR